MPLTVNPPATEEEALEINPPTKVAVGLTAKVVTVVVATPLKKTELEALRLAVESKPPLAVARPVRVVAPVTAKVLANVAAPVTMSVDEALRAPLTFRPPAIDDEALEINPPVKVDNPVTPSVLESVAAPEAVMAATVVAPVTPSVPPTDTLLPTVVAAKAPAEGIKATIAVSTKDKILLLLDIVFIDSF